MTFPVSLVPSPDRPAPAPAPAPVLPGPSGMHRDDAAAPAREDALAVRPSVLESERLTLRQVLDIRARFMAGEFVAPPVPVTEILRISLGRAAIDPAATVKARSLYEGMQGVFSAPSGSASAVAQPLRAA